MLSNEKKKQNQDLKAHFNFQTINSPSSSEDDLRYTLQTNLYDELGDNFELHSFEGSEEEQDFQLSQGS